MEKFRLPNSCISLNSLFPLRHALCPMRYALPIRIPKSKIRNRKIPTSEFKYLSSFTLPFAPCPLPSALCAMHCQSAIRNLKSAIENFPLPHSHFRLPTSVFCPLPQPVPGRPGFRLPNILPGLAFMALGRRAYSSQPGNSFFQRRVG
jgi:hypothetical protein